MRVIGLCGQSGAGKGIVCSFFEELNVKCIDTDKVYHSIISTDSPCTKELIYHFGEQIYKNPGIDRLKLRNIVFESEDNLKKLNEITHRHILNEVKLEIRKIKESGTADGIIIDAPLLFESGFNDECDATIAVISDTQTKIKRIIERDGINTESAYARIEAQIPDAKLKDLCTYIIENNSDLSNVKNAVLNLKKLIFEKNY